MLISVRVNGRDVCRQAAPGTPLQAYLRDAGFLSVKCGCDSANCGACTVLMDGKPVLSCAVLAARAAGHEITTLEGLRAEAEEFGGYLADEGGDQCGFCNPGFILNLIALRRENPRATEEEARAYLAGNLCRCTGFQSHGRAIARWLAAKGGEHA